MNFILKTPYRRFFGWFVLLPSVFLPILATIATLLWVKKETDWTIFYIWYLAILSVPIWLALAQIIAHLQLKKSWKNIVLSAIVAFVLGLIYVILLWLINQNNWDFNKLWRTKTELLAVATFVMTVTGIQTAIFLPKKSIVE